MLHRNTIKKVYNVEHMKDAEETELFQQEKNGSQNLTRKWEWRRWTEQRVKHGALLYWAVLLMAGTGIIHLAGVLLQPTQSGAIAAVLLCAAIVQIVVALIIVRVPARRLLLAATVIEGCATLLWIIAHTGGFSVGLTTWQPETLGLHDVYLPFMEGVSAFFFLCLFGYTWTMTSRGWHITLSLLPLLLLVVFVLWGATKPAVGEIIPIVFLLDAGLPTSLEYLFLPAAGLVALLLVLCAIVPRLRVRAVGVGQTALVLLPALLIVNILIWTGSISAANTAWFPLSPGAGIVKAAAGQMTTLEYCRSTSSPLAMDLSEPSSQVARPVPVVLYIHGGEALQGSRTLIDGTADGIYLTQLRENLVHRGFAVGSIDYELAPFYRVVDEIKEAKCTVRFLRAHAGELGIDPQRIGVYGPSQGGYISAMLGTAGPQAGFDEGQYLNQSSSVQAVVDMFGPTDLNNFSGSPSWVGTLKQAIGGGKGSVASLRKLSPINYVAPSDPPFLIIHGTDDWFIAPHHSQDMAKRLSAEGVPVQLVMVQHNSHGIAAPTTGQTEQPSPDELVQMITSFFVKSLRAGTQ